MLWPVQVVFVHRFKASTNVTRLVARLAEGQSYFNSDANIAFNVTAIVRLLPIHARYFKILPQL